MTHPMITWFPVRKQGLVSAVETFCRFSTRRTSTGGRSVRSSVPTCSTSNAWADHRIFNLTGLSHRGRQCRSNSQPATWREEESIREERSGARYHRYSSQWHAAERGSSSHYADLTQTPCCTNTLETKTTSVPLHIILAFHVVLGRSSPSLLQSVTLSVSTGELVMSIVVTEAPWLNLLVVKLQGLTFTNSHWLRSGDKNPVNTDQIDNDLFSHEMCSDKRLWSLELSAKYAVLNDHKTGGESQLVACPLLLKERKMTAQLYCPWGPGRTHLCTSTLSIYYSN